MTSDQIQVLATPEAYKLIEGNCRGVEFFEPVREAIKLALDKRDYCSGYASAASPLGFRVKRNYKEDGTTVILIYVTDYLPVIPIDEDFEKGMEEAIPIQIV